MKAFSQQRRAAIGRNGGNAAAETRPALHALCGMPFYPKTCVRWLESERTLCENVPKRAVSRKLHVPMCEQSVQILLLYVWPLSEQRRKRRGTVPITHVLDSASISIARVIPTAAQLSRIVPYSIF